MGLAIFAVCLCFFNIVLWFILFRQFKRTFSPNTILSEISQEVNKLLIEISRETDADLTLIEERRRGLMQLLEKADKRILRAEDELQKRDTEKKVLNDLTAPAVQSIDIMKDAEVQTHLFKEDLPKNESKQSDLFDIQVSISDDARLAQSVSEQNDPFASVIEQNRAAEELEAETHLSHSSIASSQPEPTIIIKPPLIKPTPRQSLKEQASELHRAGMSIESIANRLGRTKTEIEIALAVSE